MPCVTRENCVRPAVWRTTQRPLVGIARHRARRRRPRLAGLVVADEDRLAGRIADRIVRERRQPVLAAVAGPGVRRARRRDDRAEPRVGDDVHPGHRRFLGRRRGRSRRSRPSSVKPPSPFAQRHRRRGNGDDRGQSAAVRSGDGHERRRRRVAAASGRSSCVRKIAAVAAQNGARHRFEQHAFGVAHPVGAQQIGAAGPMLPGAPRAVVEDGRELRLHLVQVADRMLVDDDDVGAAALSAASTPAPAATCRTSGTSSSPMHADEQDRQIAGDARAATARAGRARSRDIVSALARSEPSRAEHARGEPLEQHRLVGGDAQMAQAALGVRRAPARTCAPRRWDRGTSARAPRRSRDPRPCRSRSRAARWRPAASRIRWRRLTIGSSTMPVVPESARPSSADGIAGLRPRPRKRARSVSHSSGPCGRPSRLSAWNAQAAGLVGIARPPMAQQRGAVRQVLGLDEQLAERRMGEIVDRRRRARSRHSS